MSRTNMLLLLAVLAALGSTSLAFPAEEAATGFRAGAARVDITPKLAPPVTLSGFGDRGGPADKIRDRIYYRAIVIDDGNEKAAIIVGDILAISHAFWERMTKEIGEQLDIEQQNVVLCATHTHAAPDSKFSETDGMVQKIISLLGAAIENLEPARAGAAKGYCNVNICRVARTATGNVLGGWWLGQNPEGPADKTMHVVKFETLDGTPIAILANYSAHGTTMGQHNLQISGDHPGACSRFVENHYGDDVVAAWTSGAAGDLDPIYAYREDFGGRISPVDVLGKLQGEEVIRLVETIQTRQPKVMHAIQSVVLAPGQKNLSGKSFRPDGSYEFTDADPVQIRLTVLQLDEIAICGVSGEVLTMIGQRFKEQAPLKHAFMVTHANGSSGYLPNNEAYKNIGYEILVTKVRPGVERIVTDGLIDLIKPRK